MIKAELTQKKTLRVGDEKIDVFQLPDGSYLISLEHIAEFIRRQPRSLIRRLHSRKVQLFLTNIQEKKQVLAITPEVMISLLNWQSARGNRRSLKLIRFLSSISIEQYLNRSFKADLEAENEIEIQNSDVLRESSIQDNSSDLIWQAYLASEREREEVYRRLANS